MDNEDSQLTKDFLSFFYQQPQTTIYPILRDKYKNFRQQGYNTPKPSRSLNFLKKFDTICNYICFIVQTRAEKTDISLIQSVMESIYNDYQQFFMEGGWSVVKNKSIKCHLQQHLLLKLAVLFTHNRSYGSLDRFVLCFFYTLNYFKTCNYEIRLFNEFLLGQFQLDYFFIFILLRKRSRRVNRDLVIRNEYVTSFVQVIKSEQIHMGSLMSVEGDEEGLGEIKLLLIYSQIAEYVQQHDVVMHEVMIFNLMKNVGLCQQQQTLVEGGRTNWREFVALHFKELCKMADNNYQQLLLQQIVNTNLALAQRIIVDAPLLANSRDTYNESEKETNIYANDEKEKFLEQSFSHLITVVQGIVYGRTQICELWRRMYAQCSVVYDYDIQLVKKLARSIFGDEKYYNIYSKYFPSN